VAPSLSACVAIPLLLVASHVSPPTFSFGFVKTDVWIWTHQKVLPAGWSRTGWPGSSGVATCGSISTGIAALPVAAAAAAAPRRRLGVSALQTRRLSLGARSYSDWTAPGPLQADGCQSWACCSPEHAVKSLGASQRSCCGHPEQIQGWMGRRQSRNSVHRPVPGNHGGTLEKPAQAEDVAGGHPGPGST
jgi:hypothetical protein